MSKADDRFSGELGSELEQLIRAAGDYVVVSEELRARVVDAGRREVETIRLRRVILAMGSLVAAALVLCWVWYPGASQRPSRDDAPAVSGDLSLPNATGPGARIQAAGWGAAPRFWMDQATRHRPNARANR